MFSTLCVMLTFPTILYQQEGYSSVRFWPAVVQRMVSDAGGGEWEVEFAEDKVGSNQVWSHGSKDD